MGLHVPAIPRTKAADVVEYVLREVVPAAARPDRRHDVRARHNDEDDRPRSTLDPYPFGFAPVVRVGHR